MQSAIACLATPALPKIALPEIHFHSLSISGDIMELFDGNWDEFEDMAWQVVAAYTPEQAIAQLKSTIRRWTSEHPTRWSPESEWEIDSHYSVAESEVVENAKRWDLSFDDTAKSLMAWRCECDYQCEHCARYSLDQLVPTCGDCYRCKFCVEDGAMYRQLGSSFNLSGPCPECHWV